MHFDLLVALSALVIGVIPCHGDYINAKTLWDEERTVCDVYIESLTESIRTEVSNKTRTRLLKIEGKDAVVVSYENFRCCLKKSWINVVRLESMREECLRDLVGCIVDSVKGGCKMSSMDYFMMTASKPSIMVFIMGTIGIIVTTIFVLQQISKSNFFAGDSGR